MAIEFNYEYPEKLDPVYNFKGRYILLKGGRSSGKSHFIARKLLEDRLHLKRDLLCIREYQANLEQSNYKLFKNLILQYNLPFEIFKTKFISPVGAEIVFQGMNELTEDNVKSYEGFHDAWVEEAQNFKLSSQLKLDPTIRQNDSQIFYTMNPDVEDDEVRCEIENHLKDDALIIHINYMDNPFCPKSIIKVAELCKKNKPAEYKHIWLGQPRDQVDNTVVKYFTTENIKPVNYLNNQPLYLTCDFNVDPMCWILAHKTDKKVFFFDEIISENTTTQKTIDFFLEKYKDHKSKIIINGDASGDSRSTTGEYSNYVIIRNTLQKAGFNIDFNLRHYNPPIKNRISAWNAKIKNDYGGVDIIIDPKCKWLIYNCRKLKYKIGTSIVDVPTHHQIKSDNKLKFMEHPFDAASYLVEYYYPVIINNITSPIKPKNILERFKEHR